MKYLIAFIKIIRWPNLVFIALAQFLFYFFIAQSLIFPGGEVQFNDRRSLLFLLMGASVLIAAAGYIINDYFDVNIDVVNKPEKVIVERLIKRRWAMLLHIIISIVGIAISIYVSSKVGNRWIAIGNIICVFLLLVYSTTFKKKVLSGNIIISLLTSWVIMVIYFFAGGAILDFHGFNGKELIYDAPKLYLLSIIYAGFAFITSIIREVIKDMEDMVGDDRYQCRTLPLVWGVNAAKTFCAVWIVVLIGSLVIACGFAFQSGWWLSFFYVLICILLPLLFILNSLYKASLSSHYHSISIWVKLVMLAGILSMIFFKSLS